MIPVLFNILFFLIPLVFFKTTSELFEFNKIITLYAFTTIITSIWIINSIRARKFIFRHTILDWPFVIYLVILSFSTLLSIDPRTSLLGYYSRFNGGLISQICYVILYWAYVSNLNKKQSLSTMYSVLISTAIASILAVLEHFGLFTTCGVMGLGWKQSCWVQDVQARVFSTLGQPNWLAALLVALIPLTFRRSPKYYLISILFFVTLLFTKSRSGLLAFGIEAITFWGYVFIKEKGKYLKEFLILLFISVAIYFIVNPQLVTRKLSETIPVGPALETGGTESGTIRKYVWLGALEVFKNYPILGTGPETFAFSFPMYKPVEHNLTSEWDFIYNKAHNEFLNYLANTGILGFISYSSLIIYSIIIFWKLKRIDYLAGFLAISVTNFFGFSVVPVSLLFFLFPAMAIVQSTEYKIHLDKTKLKLLEKVLILIIFCTLYFVLSTIYKYWNTDINYNLARSQNRSGNSEQAIFKINEALSFSPKEPNYLYELSLADETVETAKAAFNLAPYNQNVRRILISNLAKSAGEKPDNLFVAEEVILEGIKVSPHDPRLYYQLGILQLKIGKEDDAIKNLEKSVELKTNYKDGRYALGMTYKELSENIKAKEQFDYILEYIDPNDELTKKYLEEIDY